MFKKISIILATIILIPILTYVLLSVGTQFVFGVYVGVHHLKVADMPKGQALAIMRSLEYYGSLIGESLTVGALLLFFLIPKEGLIKRCRFKKFDIRKLPTLIFLIVGIAILSIVFIHLTQNDVTGYKQIEHTMAKTGFTIPGAIILVLIVPILEEIIFRGAILATLRKYMPVAVAVIIQGIIFSLLHGNLIQSAYTLPLGIALGLAFVYAKSIWADIICHMTFNLLGILVLPIISYFFYNGIVYTVIGVIFLVLSFVFYKKNQKSLKLSKVY
ncbi:CPBP family intramembrane glutamic endopeptidase [uncultured Clostridium sp.]|jgi:hypothetical protein|uniref:CPBP family intramembrane glutamic endopeptidase n=1 Tax=uncultured Clostridium sp. TaxID=59620 RepID=UPI00260DC037|nr:CPBP family intramembrane glutamic endopeptidase [uncultured Clostridium sp.]